MLREIWRKISNREQACTTPLEDLVSSFEQVVIQTGRNEVWNSGVYVYIKRISEKDWYFRRLVGVGSGSGWADSIIGYEVCRYKITPESVRKVGEDGGEIPLTKKEIETLVPSIKRDIKWLEEDTKKGTYNSIFMGVL